jgi:hypothetical protein
MAARYGERLHRDRQGDGAPRRAIEDRATIPPAAPASRVAPIDEYGVTPEKNRHLIGTAT